ncbi:MAG TPA: cytochrome c-type biogenesis protein [Solimonas sp.]|nr:cytochrome c-type biogenesis protein [Solimonas sp.]
MLRILLLCGLWLAAQPALSAEAATAHDERYQYLVNELRCLVCQNQSIAESNAPLAQDLRAQVRRQLDEGRSDAEIRDYLTARYGDFVLYRPPFKAATWLLWLGPFALLAVALAVALRLLRSRPKAAPPAMPDPEQLRRILDKDT